jgi:deazaflavin-dependent oxidoreductase (nitroreductase family)
VLSGPTLADEDFCYLTTTGRVSGRPHTIEIWFAFEGRTLYMLSGGREKSDWVKNLRRDSAVTLRIGDSLSEGRARVVSDAAEDALARRLLLEKYQGRYGGDLSRWGTTALPVAVDFAFG